MTVRRPLAEAQVALMLLTRLPAGRIAGEAPALAAAGWAFPLAGLAVGALSALVWLGAGALGLPSLAAAPLALAAGALATGGLHEDGLADLADGLGGGRDRAQKLEIMRDSRIGSYGVLALIFVICFKISALSVLPQATGALALMALGAASRGPLALWMAVLPTARADGLGHSAAGAGPGAVSLSLTLGLLALLLALGPGAGLAGFLAVLGGGLAVALLALRQIGGQTGDVLGAIQMIGETCGWLVLAALL